MVISPLNSISFDLFYKQVLISVSFLNYGHLYTKDALFILK